MNIQDAIFDGLDSLLLGSTNTFKTAIGSRLFRIKASDGESLPYVVVGHENIEQERDSMYKRYSVIISFLIASTSLPDVESIAGYLYDRLEDSEASLTISGFDTQRIERLYLQPPIWIEGVYNSTDQYLLRLEKN